MSKRSEKPEKILSNIRSIDPQSFEELISDVWEFLGYNTETTPSTNDRGIDVVATREFPYDEKLLIQAKRYGSNSTVSSPEMQKYGRLTSKDDTDSVLVISTGGFTNEAREVAEEENIKCIDGYTLAELIIREDIYEFVQSYVSDQTIQTPDSKRSPVKRQEQNHASNILVDEGEHIQIEVVGFENRHIECLERDEGDTFENKKYTVIAMHVQNKTSYEWNFRASKYLSVISADGFSYENLHSNGWSDYKGQLTPWHNAYLHDIRPNSKSRIVAFYETWFEPKKIEYIAKILHTHGDENKTDGKERISVHIDESVRENARGLPESIPIDSICLN